MPAHDPAPDVTQVQPSAADSSTSPADTVPTHPLIDPSAPAVPGYRIEGVLGRGGMGVVYSGTHLHLKQRRAVKVILGGGHASPGAIARLRAEAATVAALDHPNVVRVFDAGDAGGLPFLAMELCPGGSLADRLTAGPLPAAEAVALMAAVARGVGAAHARGIVHRDLKPANILFAADGTPKVADFGLAKQAEGDSGLTATFAVMGTPAYMAPEQAEGKAKAVGPAADVWAVGVMLYECLTGCRPFIGDSVLETLDRVRFGKLLPPRKLNPAVPPAVEAVCLRCLRRKPAERYATAAEVADELAGGPAAPRRPDRRRMTAAGGVGLCLLIGGLVLMASWRAGGPVGDAGAGQPPRSTADDRQERDQQFADDLAAMETVPRDRRPPRVEPVPPAGATALPPAGRRHALLIGVKQYTGPGVGIEYKYTERDVDEFARLLNRRWGFARADIRLQTQWAAGENPRQAPTGANIRRQLARMRAEAGPADSVLVALTGTGFQTGPAGEYHFVPEDGHPDRPDTLISQTELFAALTTCPAGVKVLVVDTCRGFQPRAVRPTPPQVPGPFAVFFGCQPGEYAMELDGLQHGVLTDAVLRGLGGAADANRDGSVTQGELDGFVRRRVGESLREVVGPDGRPHPQHPELVSGLPADTVLFAPPLESAPAGTTARPGVFGD